MPTSLRPAHAMASFFLVLAAGAMATEASKPARRYAVEVGGATDAGATAKVRAALGALPGVQNVAFDPVTGKATLTMKNDKATVTQAQVAKALAATDASYTVASFAEVTDDRQ